jgi:hypothetical protein
VPGSRTSLVRDLTRFLSLSPKNAGEQLDEELRVRREFLAQDAGSAAVTKQRQERPLEPSYLRPFDVWRGSQPVEELSDVVPYRRIRSFTLWWSAECGFERSRYERARCYMAVG